MLDTDLVKFAHNEPGLAETDGTWKDIRYFIELTRVTGTPGDGVGKGSAP